MVGLNRPPQRERCWVADKTGTALHSRARPTPKLLVEPALVGEVVEITSVSLGNDSLSPVLPLADPVRGGS